MEYMHSTIRLEISAKLRREQEEDAKRTIMEFELSVKPGHS